MNRLIIYGPHGFTGMGAELRKQREAPSSGGSCFNSPHSRLLPLVEGGITLGRTLSYQGSTAKTSRHLRPQGAYRVQRYERPAPSRVVAHGGSRLGRGQQRSVAQSHASPSEHCPDGGMKSPACRTRAVSVTRRRAGGPCRCTMRLGPADRKADRLGRTARATLCMRALASKRGSGVQPHSPIVTWPHVRSTMDSLYPAMTLTGVAACLILLTQTANACGGKSSNIRRLRHLACWDGL